MNRLSYLAGWGYVAIAAMLIYRQGRPEVYGTEPVALPGVVGAAVRSGPAGWFERMKQHCNTLEAELSMANDPPPSGWEGAGYGASCWALAGKIGRARQLIDALPKDDRFKAAGIVFDVGHPVADAGDDESAGPIMQLVVEYWPNHYMALYHAGIAQFRTGDLTNAEANLDAFMREYKQEDGWTGSARATLEKLRSR